MGWLNFGGKKRDRAQGFGDSSKTKSRKRPKSFILEKIVTPSAGFGDWNHEFDQLHQLLGSLSLSDLHLPNFFADGGVCPIDPGAPTNNLPPLIDFDPLGLYHDGIATQTPYNPGGAFETLPIALIPVDPHSPNPSNPNAIRQLLNFPLANQPLLGSIDTGVSADSPYLNYANIKKGRDYVGGDDNPLLKAGEGSEHGTFMLGIIDAINQTAPKWVGRAIDSGRWADSLVEFVDAAKASGQKNAIANLSLDLTQKNADGIVTTRYELTTAERSAIEYARQNGVMLVVAAGNDGGVMSVLGQASQEFDNIFTVGAGDINGRSNYSSYGRGLDIVADGGTSEHPALSTVGNDLGTMAGTSVATAKVAGAASLVWAANPALNYRQVMEILKSTARDLGPSGWDDETGFGFLNTLAAVDLAKKTAAEVYRPTPWVTPGTWSGEGKVTPEERAAKGGNSLAAATVQVSTNFSDSDRVDASQPDKYYQFTVNEPGYVKWNLISLNLVSGFPTPPNVSVIKADGKPGSHIFSKGISLSSSVIGEGQTSFSGGNFYDPGTYYLKVGNGAGSSFKDYNISTQFIADQVSSFTGNIQYRTQPYYSLDNSLQSAVFSGPAVSELSNLSGVVTYDNIQFNNRIAKYGVEVNESGKIRINLNSPNGKMEVSVKKFIGSDDRPESIASLEVSANSDGWLELDLNKGRYDIEVKTPSNFWLEPDWNWTQEKLVRPYTLNATFTPNAPQPGQGKVPSSAGAFDKTVVSNGVVNHYYKNGYLTVQPSGQASWYGYPSGVVSISVQPLNDPVPLADPDGNYSIQTAQDLSYSPADFGDGVDRRGALGSIGGNNLNDFYKFSLNSLKLVNLKLSQLSNGAKLELIQDRNGNGQVDFGEVITTNLTGLNSPSSFSFDKILGAGSYYLRVSPGSSGATTKYQLDVAEQSPENQVIAGYNSDYYLVQNAQLRIIPNQETLNALKINPNTVKRFPPEDLARIPYGDALPSQKDGDVFADFAGNIYLMESGKRRLVPDWDTLRAMGINVTGMSRFPESDLKDIEPGDPYVRLNHWQASFINRNAGNVAQFNIDDFNNPVATLDLGVQGSGDGKISLYRNWGLDSPDNRVQKDYFAMQASTRTNMQAGKLYQVRTKSDDGTRFLLKNLKTGEVKTIEQLGGWSDGDWRGRGADEPNKIIYFKVPDSGDYDFYVQYYENDGGSTVDVSLEEAKPFQTPATGSQWNSKFFWWDKTKGNMPPGDFYKDGSNVIGTINLGPNQRSDGKSGIQLDWGENSPNNDTRIPKDDFAVRSYTQTYFEAGKTYRVRAKGDDGFQLLAKLGNTENWVYITPQDQWQQSYNDYKEYTFTVPQSGMYDFHFHHYEKEGGAKIDLYWEEVQQQNNGGSNNSGGGSVNSGTIPDNISAKSAIPGGIKDSSIKGSFAKDIIDAVNGGVIRQDVGNFLMGIVATESGGNWQAGRGSYYLGAFQIGKDHIQKYAQLTGVDITSEQFLNNKDLQLKVAQWLYDENLKWINNLAKNGFSGWTTEPDKQPLAQYFADKSTLYKSAYFWLAPNGGPDGNGVYSKDYARAADESAQLISQTLSGSSGNNSGGTTGIKIELLDPDRSFTPLQMLKIRQAAENWQRIIQKDKANGLLKIAVTAVPGLQASIGNVAQTTRDDGGPNNRTNIMGGNQDGSVTINGVRYDNKIEFDPDYISQHSNTTLVRLAMHEIGHTLGLKHEDGEDGDSYDTSLGPNGLMNHNSFPPNITPGIYDRLESLGYKVNRDPSIIKWS